MSAAADPAVKFQTYAHPERVVSTEWLAEHLEDPTVVVVESDEDVLLYHTGHIPGAIKIDWVADLNDPLVRDYLDEEHFAALMSRHGISPETTVVFYGDNFNWWAAYALWVFELFGHADTRLLDGGRAKWVEEGRPLSTDEPSRTETSYPVPKRNDRRIRAFLADVLPHSKEGKPLIDVRSPEEFQFDGHVAGARLIPLPALAQRLGEIAQDVPIALICRSGNRSQVAADLLIRQGYADVSNVQGGMIAWRRAGLPTR